MEICLSHGTVWKSVVQAVELFCSIKITQGPSAFDLGSLLPSFTVFCTVEADSVPHVYSSMWEGKKKTLRANDFFLSNDVAIPPSFLLLFHWQELCHMATPSSKGWGAGNVVFSQGTVRPTENAEESWCSSWGCLEVRIEHQGSSVS